MTKKKILVVYYSQTRQLSEIVKSLTRPFKKDSTVEVEYEELQMKEPFPFPWNADQFWDAFPESVLEVPFELEPTKFNADQAYDLVILAGQPWFLSPSIPINSFLHTEKAAKILKNTPVVTVMGARNMWLTAHEKVKKRLNDLQAHLCGNITLVDKHSNLISLITIIGWLFKGKKEGFMNIFPRSGVDDEEIRGADKFGETILDHLLKDDFSNLQEQLLKQNAVQIKPSLMILEKRGAKTFPVWARFIRRKGAHGDPARKFRLKLFAYILPTGIVLLSPVTALLTFLTKVFRKQYVNDQINYYSYTSLEPVS